MLIQDEYIANIGQFIQHVQRLAGEKLLFFSQYQLYKLMPELFVENDYCRPAFQLSLVRSLSLVSGLAGFCWLVEKKTFFPWKIQGGKNSFCHLLAKNLAKIDFVT